MAFKFESQDWMAARNQLKSQAGPSAHTPLSTSEWNKREQFKVKVIEARVKLKLMRDRTDALKEALERYRLRSGSTRA